MKKVLAIVLCIAMLAALGVSLVACNNDGDDGELTIALPAYEAIENPDYSALTFADDFKVGLICLHDENSTYDLNFIEAMNETKAALGLKDSQVIIKNNIPEANECYLAAADLVDQGCDVIFANSFGHEDYIIQAAREFPDVEFCHATGTQAHTAGLANFHNAFASIYEGRYLAGIAAGMKLKAMMEADSTIVPKIGYVGAYTYAEVISGYTSFYLGVKSIVSNVTMDVQFTGSWYDETAEKNAAEALISGGCVLISQHADSWGAPTACEQAGVPNVSYNGSTVENCPNTFIVSSRINWAPYYKLAIANTVKGEAIPTDYTGSIKTGSVVLTDVGATASAEGTVEALVAARTALANGTLNVFDTANFTVGGQALTSYLADVDTDAAFTPDTEAISNGIFLESNKRSAPYFDVKIDGITLLNTMF